MRRDLLLACVIFSAAMSIAGTRAAPSAFKDKIDSRAGRCERVTVEELWSNPWPYGGKRVCLTAYLGRMVLHGEESVDVFDTKPDAAARHSEHYVTLSVPLNMNTQTEIAGHSVEKLDAVGTFQFDPRCWPQKGEEEARFECFPSRPMVLGNAEIALARQ